MYSPQEMTMIATDCLNNMNSTYVLNFWQQWYIELFSRFFAMLKSRRIGWSFISSMKSTIEAQHEEIYRYQRVFVSYGMRDAVGKIADARMAYMNIRNQWKKDLKTDSKTQLEFWDKGRRSASTLISIPNQSLRGFGTTNKIGGVTLDEFAFHRDDESVYASALPCLSRGGTLEIGSTPLAAIGKFYDVISDEKKYDKYKRITIPWWMSSALCINVSEAIDKSEDMDTEERVALYGNDVIQDIFASLPLRMFLQEYECNFTDETDAFISMEMIMSCTPEENPQIGTHEQYHYSSVAEFIHGGELRDVCVGIDGNGELIYSSSYAPGYDPDIHGILFAGWDMGRTKDSSIFTLMGYRRDTGKKHIWMSYELKRTPFDEQKAFAANVMSVLPIRRFMIDGTGLGMDFGEWAEKKWPKIAESVQFTSEIKEVMANKMYLGFESKEFVLPMERKLHADVHCIRKTTTLTKHSRYDGSTKDSHADRFWSMALANMGPSDIMEGKGRFYSERKQRLDSISKSAEEKTKKVNTGNPQLDRMIRSAQRQTRRVLRNAEREDE